MSDPRPISDKSFQNACIRSLIAYLTSHGYDQPISPKALSTPTGKEFLHIVQFLFRMVDPNIKFVSKTEEEVPMLFKRVGYPFAISKSALAAVGSPHTWPGLLAALSWLVELLVYEENANASKSEVSGGVDVCVPKCERRLVSVRCQHSSHNLGVQSYKPPFYPTLGVPSTEGYTCTNLRALVLL
jgi:SMC interacting uncharacterized protein involved in chromosome segregation